jgi:hypothetical protein
MAARAVAAIEERLRFVLQVAEQTLETHLTGQHPTCSDGILLVEACREAWSALKVPADSRSE